MTTPFEKAGYTKDTKFKVLKTYTTNFSVGDVVELRRDDHSSSPVFINKATGATAYMWLPGLEKDDSCALEVYHEASVSEEKLPSNNDKSSPTVTITHNLTIKGYTHVLTTAELMSVYNFLKLEGKVGEQQ